MGRHLRLVDRRHRLRALGQSTEGRTIWHVTLGPDPDRVRPAVWVVRHEPFRTIFGYQD